MKRDQWSQIQSLFLDALDRPRGERRDFIERAVEDREVQEEVLTLLAAHEDDPDFLAEPIASPHRSETGGGHEPIEGTRIGPYELIRPLGEGGMGRVYLARQETEAFSRFVALKVVKRGMDTDEVLRRFAEERRILASLRHPHIAHLLDAGATSDGRPFFVMEYVEGERLDDWVRRVDPPLTHRLELVRTLCSAVQHAHQNLVLHQDIKPANVLVTADGTPKLVDFGIGRLLDASGPSARTATHARRLTPEYAAPEQLAGAGVTTGADVFGLGVLLYEVLTGTRPWTGPRTPDSTTPRPSDSVSRDDARSRPERSRWARALRGDLDNIVAMATRPDVTRRYGSAAALSDDLRRYLEGRPVLARSDSLVYRGGKFVRRNPWLVATVGTVVVGSVGLAAASQVQSARLERERDKAREVQGFLLETFGASTADGSAGDSVSVRQLLDGQRAIVPSLYASDPELEIQMLSVLAEAYEGLGLNAEAAELAGDALEHSRDHYDGDHPDVAHALNLVGWIAHQRGESDTGVTRLEESVAMWRRIEGGDPSGLARALNDLGSVLDQLGRADEAGGALREALALRQASDRGFDRGVAVTSSNLAVLMYRRGDYAAADSLGQLALDRLRATVGPDHRRTFIAQGNLATFRWVAGDLDGAIALYEDLLERRGRLDGGPNARTANDMLAYASALRAQGRPEDAEVMLREALSIQEAVMGPEHRVVGNTTNVLATVLSQTGRPAEALPLFERAIQVLTGALGPEHGSVGDALIGRGIVEQQLGRTDAALRSYEEGARILESAFGPDHDSTRDARDRLSRLNNESRR